MYHNNMYIVGPALCFYLLPVASYRTRYRTVPGRGAPNFRYLVELEAELIRKLHKLLISSGKLSMRLIQLSLLLSCYGLQIGTCPELLPPGTSNIERLANFLLY
jgi:hypothetical protein